MEGVSKLRKPRGTWQLGGRMEKLKGGEGKGTTVGEKPERSVIFLGRVSVTLGMSLQWGVTVTVVVPVLQASGLRFRVTDLTQTANSGSHGSRKRLTAPPWSPQRWPGLEEKKAKMRANRGEGGSIGDKGSVVRGESCGINENPNDGILCHSCALIGDHAR